MHITLRFWYDTPLLCRYATYYTPYTLIFSLYIAYAIVARHCYHYVIIAATLATFTYYTPYWIYAIRLYYAYAISILITLSLTLRLRQTLHIDITLHYMAYMHTCHYYTIVLRIESHTILHTDYIFTIEVYHLHTQRHDTLI